MVFHSKTNTLFSLFVCILIPIIGAATILPAVLMSGTVPVVALLLSLIFLIITVVLLWMVFSVTYIFYAEYLLIITGPFRSRIPYNDITKVSRTKNILTGHRMSSSKDSLEVFNKKTALKSAKLSPIYIKEFVFELKKRNPSIQIEE